MSCYCGHPYSHHMEGAPRHWTPEVSPDGVEVCTVNECPCEGYDPIKWW